MGRRAPFTPDFGVNGQKLKKPPVGGFDLGGLRCRKIVLLVQPRARGFPPLLAQYGMAAASPGFSLPGWKFGDFWQLHQAPSPAPFPKIEVADFRPSSENDEGS
jgi:hypothetical protein